jgi:hypothetical protein
MKFSTPKKFSNSNSNSNSTSSIIIVKDKYNDQDYYTVKAAVNIKKGAIILLEYPECVLYGETDIDRGLQVVKKYIESMESMDCDYIKELYPRNYATFTPNKLSKNVHKIIKHVEDAIIARFFNQYSKREIEFYYAKYLYNAFEGFQYGPLTLPLLAKFNHSCRNNNIAFSFDNVKGCMIAKTTKNINKGDELFNSYLYNKKILNHKEYLLEHYNFKCGC